MERPIVFMSDYGLADEFVGICHGVVARIAPRVKVIDLTHAIPRHDVVIGAMALGRSAPFMPQDAVYLGVVDPGVGSARRPVAVACRSGALLVGPDNGVLSMAWATLGGADRAAEITSERVLLGPVSATFHGRDVFAPAAAHLSIGMPLHDLGPPVDPRTLHTVEMPAPMILQGVVGARVMGVDGYGNVQLNARPGDLEAAGVEGSAEVCGRIVSRVSTFSDVAEGSPAAIVDSQGFVALVVNGGSAADVLGLHRGDAVTLSRPAG
jgi:S-adenosyl-L-methionine hydrolase (adenosine-forming)